MLEPKTGKSYNGQDVRNIIKKISETDINSPKAEEILAKIKDGGGVVSYSRDNNNFVDVLWIQTADMVNMLKNEKPRLFQHDTTFGELSFNFLNLNYVKCFAGTQKEGYKLHIPIYQSTTVTRPKCGRFLVFSSSVQKQSRRLS